MALLFINFFFLFFHFYFILFYLIYLIFIFVGFAGYGLSGDLRRLKESFPQYSGCFNIDTASVLDLSTPATLSSHCERYHLPVSMFATLPAASMGLSQLSLRVLGREVNKTMQCSDWQQRPLSKEQIIYAALDAMILLRIVAKLVLLSSQ